MWGRIFEVEQGAKMGISFPIVLPGIVFIRWELPLEGRGLAQIVCSGTGSEVWRQTIRVGLRIIPPIETRRVSVSVQVYCGL